VVPGMGVGSTLYALLQRRKASGRVTAIRFFPLQPAIVPSRVVRRFAIALRGNAVAWCFGLNSARPPAP
jgi:hypothetical protein